MLTDNDLKALYIVAADFHSGQNSRGYRLLCHVRRLMLKRGIVPDFYSSKAIGRAYNKWADKFADFL